MNPDRQAIVDLATVVDQRMRRQDQARFLTRAFIWSLVVPAFLTVASLVGVVPPWALITLLSGWALAMLGAAIWTWTRTYPLSRAAAEIDRRASLNNELTSALWFVQNEAEASSHDRPDHDSHSDWVNLHVQRASQTARRVDAEALLPWRWPDEARTAAALAGVLIVLNGLMAIDLVPRSWTRAWLQAKLSGTRAVTEDEKKAARDLKELLQQVQQLDPALMTQDDRRLAQQLAALVDDLDKELLSSLDASERLAKIREALEKLADAEQGKTPLDARAKALTGRDLKQLEDALKRALEDAKAGRKDQTEPGEPGETDEELRSEARAEMREAALRRLKDLEKSMGGQPRPANSRQEKGKSDQSQSGDSAENQEGAQSSAEAPGQGQMQPMEGDGQQAGMQARGTLGGASGGQTNLVGPKTALQVKLRRELLASPTARPNADKPEEKKEEKYQETKQGQSKQQYQPVAPRKYAPADAIEPNQVPWPYRDLVKSYFQKVGPRGK